MGNSLSPSFIKLKYTGLSLTHFQTFSVLSAGALVAGTEPLLVKNDSTTIGMTAAMTAYLTILKAEVPATVTFVDAEFWSQPEPEDDPIWIYTSPLSIVGTNATATDQIKQRVLSMRTDQGGSGFNYLLQIPTNVAVNVRQNFPSASTPANNTLAYLLGATGVLRARDNGRFIVGNWYTTKYNDAARRKLLDF